MNELRVCVDLFAMGWQVYRAISPNASWDLMACKNGEVLRVEVKTYHDPKSQSSLLKQALQRNVFDVLAIVYADKIVYADPEGWELNLRG